MAYIEIEVDDETAKRWRNFSPELRALVEKSFKRQTKEIIRQSKLVSFDELLEIISKQAEANGTTEEISREILNEDD